MTNKDNKDNKDIEEKYKDYVVTICDDCYELKGEMCHTAECIFIRMTMKEVGEALNFMLIRPTVDGERLKLGQTLTELTQQAREEQQEKIDELVDALLNMYGQYCQDGHLFMSAGEIASTVLETMGYATFDNAGRLKFKSNK